MFTVDEVALKLNVSKVTIYSKLKKFKEEVVIKQGKRYVSEQLFNLIKNDLKIKQNYGEFEETEVEEQEKNNMNSNFEDLIKLNKELNKELIDFLQQQIIIKDKLLEEKDKQIEEKDRQINELLNLHKNSQVLLKQQQDNEQLLLEEGIKNMDEKLANLREDFEKKKNSKKSIFNIFNKSDEF